MDILATFPKGALVGVLKVNIAYLMAFWRILAENGKSGSCLDATVGTTNKPARNSSANSTGERRSK
jgi:hypothetical protein